MTVNIEAIFKEELEKIILNSLKQKYDNQCEPKLEMLASMLSWMTYASTISWQKSEFTSAEAYISQAIEAMTELFEDDMEK